MEQEVKFQVKIQVQDMYQFLMRHAYHGMFGVINLLISVGAFIMFLFGLGNNSSYGNAVLLLIAALFTIINPIYLYYKAARQVKLTAMFRKPLDYVINDAGISVRQGEEELRMEWSEVRKVVEAKKYFYIYLSLTRAYIFPKSQFLGQVEQVRKIIQRNENKNKCK